MAGSIADLSLASCPDPHGNGQPTVEIVYTDPDTQKVTRSGCFMSVHGAGPLNFRFVHGAPSNPPQSVFEIGTAYYPNQPIAGRTAISEL